MAQAKRAPARRTGGQRGRKAGGAAPADARPWVLLAAAVILGAAALRLGLNALGFVPVHFDEAQYWAYGQELAWGHFSKPPLVGWLIALGTWLGGPTTFWLRVPAVLAHAGVAATLFVLGRRLWDGRTGFWAAAGYTAAPGVTASGMVMSTDPVLMAFWALALYAWIRAAEAGQGGAAAGARKGRARKGKAGGSPPGGNTDARVWWALMGAALGLAMLAKYTGIAFALGAIGYGLFSARARDWVGTAIAGGVALVVLAPNLLWLAANGFVTIGHVAEDAAPAGPRYTLGSLLEFLGAQLGVIGPVWFLAILAAFWWRRDWLDDWRMRMLAWQSFALLGAMTLLAFWTRAQPNWAAPAYVAGSLLAARLVLARGWAWALPAQAATGAVAAAALYLAAWLYAALPGELPRGPDPFKKMRIGEPFCALALGLMAEEGAEVLLSNDRRRLSECMFYGGLRWDDIAIWNPELTPSNHHELVSTLRAGDQRPMLLATMSEAAAEEIARHFDDARPLDSGTFPTHADRGAGYSVWIVQGFRDY